MIAHRECLQEAAGYIRKDPLGKDERAGWAAEVLARGLELAANDLPPVPVDIAEERAAIGRFLREELEAVIDRFLGCPGKMPTRADGRALAVEFSRMLEKRINAGAHAEFIEIMRAEKKENR